MDRCRQPTVQARPIGIAGVSAPVARLDVPACAPERVRQGEDPSWP